MTTLDKGKPKTSKNTLYYDGTCPLCSFEIGHLQKLMDDNLCLVDVHNVREAGQQLPPKPAMLQRLHLQTAEGELVTGLDATVTAWQHTRWGFVLKVLRWPVVNTVADACYNLWASRRFAKRYPNLRG